MDSFESQDRTLGEANALLDDHRAAACPRSPAGYSIRQMSDSANDHTGSAIMVGLCGWLFPGLGYLVLGQRARAATVSISIVLLFVAGLFIGGVRILEVPGYGPHGQRMELFRQGSGYVIKERVGDFADEPSAGWALFGAPFDEIRAKPWSIAQVMTGPMSIAAASWAVRLSAPAPDDSGPIGARSHSHINDIGVLYTAVAGMLNLLAILDSAQRAAHPADESDEVADKAEPVVATQEGAIA